jgi:hypothetical protein
MERSMTSNLRRLETLQVDVALYRHSLSRIGECKAEYVVLGGSKLMYRAKNLMSSEDSRIS